MQTHLIILVGFAIILACAMRPASCRSQPTWTRHLKGSQKAFGWAAFVVAILITMNPEFLALGLLGDAAFFDLLVLTLSLQMHTYVTRAWQRFVTTITSAARWVGTPSPGLRYVMAVLTLFVGSVAAFVQKAAHRFSS